MANAPHLVLGTAGHIDHGKSSLTLALTGTDPDRLREEKKRGITIELGFAQLELPDGRTMGVVDVPGHERFVRQMIAGATGIDVALLVIAADDGIMPQTIEHVAVLETLGVPACVVALSKADLVDSDWIAFMSDEIRSFLQNTPYAQAEIIPVSSVEGTGVEEVRAAIQRACSGVEPARQHRALRLPVDRVFTIKGAGTVITGTLWSGEARVGGTVEVLPSGKTSRIRSVQMHDQPVDVACAGNRVALNLPDLSTSQIAPGDFLAEPGTLVTSDRFDAFFTYLDTAKTGKPLETGARMHVAHGTREVLGRVLFCDGKKALASGESTYAQIRLEEPLPVASSDRFIVRTYSPVQVAGGGRILLAHPRRRTNLTDVDRTMLDALRDGDVTTAVQAAVEREEFPANAASLARGLGLPVEAVSECLDTAAAARKLVTLQAEGDRLYTTRRVVQKHVSAIERALLAFHAKNPQAIGIASEDLRRQCAPRCSASCFSALVREAEAAGKATHSGGHIGHPSAQGAAAAAIDDAAAALLTVLDAEFATPPLRTDLFTQAGVNPRMGDKALNQLKRDGKVTKLDADLFFSETAIQKCAQAVRAYLEEHGEASVADLKDALGTTRKYAVPLLELLDARGVTKREGNMRTLG